MDLSLSGKAARSRLGLVSLFVFLFMFLLEFPAVDLPRIVFVKNAGAVIGRPGTPASVGGVHRRTRRRTRRRWAVGTSMYTLPVGYTTAMVAGATYYVYEGQYFKPSYKGDDVVYVAVEDPKETSTGKADTQTQPAQAQPAQAQPASTETAEQKLLELKSLYDKGLIDKQEYDAKKKEVLNSL